MSQTPYVPDDPMARFRAVYDALNAGRRWYQNASSLCFAAMIAVRCPGEAADVAAGIRRLADELKEEASWTSSLANDQRFIAGTILLLHDDTASAFSAELQRARGLFRQAGLRRSEAHEMMAALILRFRAESPVTAATVERLCSIYEEMKRHHWWLTGPDDFPACALLTAHDASPEQIGRGTEAIYQALKDEGLATGDPLQTVSHVLYLAGCDARVVARRFRELAEAFRARRVRIWQSDYDEIAILSLLDRPVAQVVERVLGHRKAMKQLSPSPDSSLSFKLAASVAFLDLAQLDQATAAIADVKVLLDMQAIIQAQQAAAAA